MGRKVNFRPTWPQYESALIKFEQLELIENSQRVKIRLLLDSDDENCWVLAKSIINGLAVELNEFYAKLKSSYNLNGFVRNDKSGDFYNIPHFIISQLELRKMKVPEVKKILDMVESGDYELFNLARILIHNKCNEKEE